MNVQTTDIVVRFQRVGFHRWYAAPPHRRYLASPHRHLFYIEVTLGVGHDDREVEFHDLLDEVKAAWPWPDGGGMNSSSCEMLARTLMERLATGYAGRRCSVSVFEDNEVGSTLTGVL